MDTPLPPDKVLFVCLHNSARSQMAEAFLKQLAGDRLRVESAGFRPAPINPLVVAVMQEIGFDLSAKKTRKVRDAIREQVTDRYRATFPAPVV